MTLIFKATKLAASLAIVTSIALPVVAQNAAAPAPRMYSATATSQLPGQPDRVGYIVKSASNLRLEFDNQGQPVAQIIRPAQGLIYFLNPEDKTYVEMRGPAVPELAVDAYTPPCMPDGGSVCRKIGQAVTSGINTERWMISAPQQSGPVIVLWDPTRRTTLHEDFADGGTMTKTFAAMEDVAGRQTEKWTTRMARPGQETVTGDWWFDPEIRAVVRETIPGGELRTLTDITVGPFDAALFAVPEGWTQKQPPAPAQNAQNPATTAEGAAESTAAKPAGN